MLKHLTIQNYALIEELELPIESGFTVITGETGAGKSIIMGALSLVLGQRADVKVLRDDTCKCVVEASFGVAGYNLEPLFEELELDYDDDCLVRRELLPNGKSRAFINDTPVTLVQLKQVTSQLIDIHSQHENLLLNEAKFQLDLVDMIAQNENYLEQYGSYYHNFVSLRKQLNDTKQLAETSQAERDYAQFQFDQLSEASLIPDEQSTLEQELEVLSHMEDIRSELGRAIQHLDGEDSGVLLDLRDALQALERVQHYMPQTAEYAERTRSAYIELKDITSAITLLANDTEYDPQRKQTVEERLDLIYSLQQKHRVDSVDGLIALKDEYEAKLLRIDAFDDEIVMLQQQLQKAESEMHQKALQLSQRRHDVKDEIQEQMELKLKLLGMQNARFQVEIVPTDYTIQGIDKVLFLFSANKNAPLQPIASIASGGEISRVMLSLKSLIVTRLSMPTIIFDEIDTGVSGDVAQRVGEMMQQMGKSMQVITITHLPQIAAKGQQQLKVFKTDTEQHTETHIIKLTEKERVTEIAEMMSGKNPSEATLKSAKELLSHA